MTTSVSGLVSGIDTNNIISQLIAVERQPIKLLEDKKEVQNKRLSEFQSLNSKLSSLLSVAKSMDETSEFIVKSASFANNKSNDNNIVIKVTPSSSVTNGSHSIVISALAKAEKEISQGFSDNTSSVGKGTLAITIGSTTTSITIDDTNNTLEGVKNAINRSGANVSASIVNVGGSTPYRLVLTGKSTGSANSISISHSVSSGTQFSFSQVETAQNASFTLDGISVSKASNLVTDVIDGASLELKSIGSGTITFSSDISAVKDNINNFVKEYNNVMSFIKDQLAFNAITNKSGTLFANVAVMDIEGRLRNTISQSAQGLSGTYTLLSQIGIKTGADGLLSIKNDELTDALNADFEGVAKVFTSFGSTNNANISFVGFTNDTKAGVYKVTLDTKQRVKTRKQGTTTYHTASGNGNFYSGASGSDEDGLRFRVNTLTTGDFGTITLSLGVIAQITREVDILLDKSRQGPLTVEFDTANSTINELDDQISDMNVRLTKKKEDITKTFTNLETQLNKLQLQGNFLTSALVNLNIPTKR